jgi:hypothetical protein
MLPCDIGCALLRAIATLMLDPIAAIRQRTEGRYKHLVQSPAPVVRTFVDSLGSDQDGSIVGDLADSVWTASIGSYKPLFSLEHARAASIAIGARATRLEYRR